MDRRLVLAAGTCSLGGLIFGFDLGALSGVTQSLRAQFSLSPVAFGLTISSSLWGTVCGSLLAGRLADSIGRHRLIAGCALIYAFAAAGVALPFTTEWSLILALRFLSGVAIGGFTVGCPLYLAEIAPITLRGRFVSLFQVQVGAGVVLAFAIASLVARFISGNAYWKCCLGLGALPAVTLLLLLRFISEEPKQFATKTRWGNEQAPTEISLGSLPREKLFSRRNMRPLWQAASIAIFNQLSGVNILLLYLLEVLASAGLGNLLGHTYTVWISCLSLASTLLGMAYVDKLGRKPLLVVGSAGMALCLAGLGFAIPRHFAPTFYLLILGFYNLCFAFSQGTVIWVYLSELFPFSVRGAGQGFGATVHWITNAALIWMFPVLQRASSTRSFYLLSLMMVLQIGIVSLWYPETKGTALGATA